MPVRGGKRLGRPSQLPLAAVGVLPPRRGGGRGLALEVRGVLVAHDGVRVALVGALGDAGAGVVDGDALLGVGALELKLVAAWKTNQVKAMNAAP